MGLSGRFWICFSKPSDLYIGYNGKAVDNNVLYFSLKVPMGIKASFILKVLYFAPSWCW